MNPTFGKLTDYFSKSGTNLRLLSSRAGYTRQVVEAANTCVISARDLSGDFLNPVCEYVVAKDCSLSFVLGQAFKYNGLGFMLTEVAVKTNVAQFPLVTLSATANEGKDAIQKHTVTFNIKARSKAQDVAGAFTLDGGAHFNQCEAVWSAEPVVVVMPINGTAKPVASDIQHGRVVSTARIVLGQASVKNGWDMIALPDPLGSDLYYEIHDVKAVKSLT